MNAAADKVATFPQTQYNCSSAPLRLQCSPQLQNKGRFILLRSVYGAVASSAFRLVRLCPLCNYTTETLWQWGFYVPLC